MSWRWELTRDDTAQAREQTRHHSLMRCRRRCGGSWRRRLASRHAANELFRFHMILAPYTSTARGGGDKIFSTYKLSRERGRNDSTLVRAVTRFQADLACQATKVSRSYIVGRHVPKAPGTIRAERDSLERCLTGRPW
jgi:hypothetical protein